MKAIFDVKILKIIFLSFAFIFLNSCKKHPSPSDNVATTGTPTQYAIYTIGFQENNLDQGVAVVVIFESPDKRVSIENFTFRFNEKDGEQIRKICNEFTQHFTAGDNYLTTYTTLADYINGFFRSQTTFKQASVLSNEQLYNLINNKNFSFALNKSNNNNLLLAFFHAFIPTAKAQSGGTALLRTFYSAIGGVIVGTAVGASVTAGVPIIVIVGIGVAGYVIVDKLTGTAINSNIFSSATQTTVVGGAAGNFASLVFGANQLTNSMNNTFVNQVSQALSGPNYTPPSQLPGSAEDFWPSIRDSFSDYIKKQQATSTMSCITNDASSINSTTAILSGKVSIDNPGSTLYTRGIIVSTDPSKIFSGTQIAGGNGVGDFNISLVNLVPNTTYYYMSYSYYVYGPKSDRSYTWGSMKSFSTSNPKIGDAAFGGMVFYIDNTGKHGLVAATTDQGSNVSIPHDIPQSGTLSINSGGAAIFDGLLNTQQLINFNTVAKDVASLCTSYKGGSFTDWYLPSVAELKELYKEKVIVGGLSSAYYTSSTWQASSYAYINLGTYISIFFVKMADGSSYGVDGYSGTDHSSPVYPPANVRAIRKF